jgi:8-oxo-dGTP diphosphatase
VSEVNSGEILVSAIVMSDSQGRVLHVRKRGTSTLMLPGGKPEPGETPAQTAAREFAEELGVQLDERQLQFLGQFRSAAANEAGFDVVAQVFRHPFVAGVSSQAEIDTLEWVHPSDHRDDLAPLNTEHVFPHLLGLPPK